MMHRDTLSTCVCTCKADGTREWVTKTIVVELQIDLHRVVQVLGSKAAVNCTKRAVALGGLITAKAVL